MKNIRTKIDDMGTILKILEVLLDEIKKDIKNLELRKLKQENMISVLPPQTKPKRIRKWH